MSIWSRFGKVFRPETKSLSKPTELEEEIFGVSLISASRALSVPAVSNAIQLISEAAASLDISVKRLDGNVEIDVPDHPLLALLRGEVNEWTSGFEFIRDLVQDALMNDAGGLAWVNRVNGEAHEIIRYRQGNLTYDSDPLTGERRYKLINRPLPARDVIHVLPPLGKAPLSLARQAISIAQALDHHADGLFRNGARPGAVIIVPKGMGEEPIKSARESWRKTHETGQKGLTAFLYDGMTFEQLSLNSTDAQFLENRKFQIQEIARAFNIPSPMLGDLERATWSNSEQKGREFLSYTLEPWLLGIEGALRRALFSDEERVSHVIRFDRDDLTRADLATRATVINSLISSRTINANEGRAWIGLPPRQGGDEYLNPNISAAPVIPDSGKNPEPPAAPNTEGDNATE